MPTWSSLLPGATHSPPWIGWLIGLAAAALVFMLLLALRRSVRARYQKLHDTPRVEVAEVPFRVLSRTSWPFLVAVSAYVGSLWLQLAPSSQRWLDGALTVLLFWQAGLWLSAAFQAWLEHKRRHSLAHDRAKVGSITIIGMVVRGLIWVLVTLLALDNLGIDITALVAGLGIGGVAVALAVQNILGDLFASLAIALDQPFVVGDALQVGEVTGTVEAIGIKSTRLRSLSGEQVIVSNADLLGSRVRNYGRMAERRVDFVVRLPFDSPADELERLPARLRRIIEAQPRVRFDRCHLSGFGAHSLDFECVYYKLSPDYNEHMDTRQAINLAILRDLESRGLRFALPTQTLHVDERHTQGGNDRDFGDQGASSARIS